MLKTQKNILDYNKILLNFSKIIQQQILAVIDLKYLCTEGQTHNHCYKVDVTA